SSRSRGVREVTPRGGGRDFDRTARAVVFRLARTALPCRAGVRERDGWREPREAARRNLDPRRRGAPALRAHTRASIRRRSRRRLARQRRRKGDVALPTDRDRRVAAGSSRPAPTLLVPVAGGSQRSLRLFPRPRPRAPARPATSTGGAGGARFPPVPP